MKITLFLISLLLAAAYSSSTRVQAGEAPVTGRPQPLKTIEIEAGTLDDGRTYTSTATSTPNLDGSTFTTTTNPDGSTSTYTIKTNADGSTTKTDDEGNTTTTTTTTKTNADGSTTNTVTGQLHGGAQLTLATITSKTNADGSTTETGRSIVGTWTKTFTTTKVQFFADGSSVVKQPDGRIDFYGFGEGPTKISLVDDLNDFDWLNLNLSIDRLDNQTVGTPKPSEEIQKVEEKKEPSWWESLVPALIPSIGIGIGSERDDRERRFPDDRRPPR
jgi:hypothetical protein